MKSGLLITLILEVLFGIILWNASHRVDIVFTFGVTLAFVGFTATSFFGGE